MNPEREYPVGRVKLRRCPACGHSETRGAWVWVILLLALGIALFGCAPTKEYRERPQVEPGCAAQMLDLNRRLCAERGGDFIEAGCGLCLLRRLE